MKGLIIYVYRSPIMGDCTNNGLSSRHNKLTLIGKDIEGVFEPSEDAPAVTMITRIIADQEYKHLIPCDENAHPLPGWYMFGGNYGKSSDSRFPNSYPLGIHDRQE